MSTVAAPSLTPTASAALAQLKDIQVPPVVPFTPQTPAWAVLAAVLGLLALWLAWRGLQRHRANRYRRDALAELSVIEKQLNADGVQRGHALAALAALLKRTALAAWPREEVAALSGEAWGRFLQTHAGGAKSAGPTLGSLVNDIEYRGGAALAGVSSADAQALLSAGRHWITQHRVPT